MASTNTNAQRHLLGALLTSAGINNVSPTLDATDERQIYFGRIVWPGGSYGDTKAIRNIRYKVNNEYLDAGASLRWYLADLDTTAGAPARDDAVEDQFVDTAPAGITQYVWNTTGNLSADRTVSYGEVVVAVAKLLNRTTGGINIQPLAAINGGGRFPQLPGYTSYLSAVYSGQDYLPNIGFVFDDGSYGYYEGDLLGAATTATYTAATAEDTTSLFSGDERGMLWVPAASYTLEGCIFPVALADNTSDVECCVYQDSTLVGSIAWQGKWHKGYGSTTHRMIHLSFAPVSVVSGDEIRMTIKATGTGNVYIGYIVAPTDLDATWLMGGEVIKATHRADAGTWYEPHVDSPRTRVWMHPLGRFVTSRGGFSQMVTSPSRF